MATDKIEANLERYLDLIGSIKELDYVLDALPRTSAELADAKLMLKTTQSDLSKLERQQADAFKAWQDLQRSTTTRLKVKLRHLRNSQQAIESEACSREHCYEGLFSEGQACLARLKETQDRVDALESEAAALRVLATKHKELQGELTVLFETVFAGPTPEYPDEDEAEDSYQAAMWQVEEYERSLKHDTKVLQQFVPLIECIERAERQFRKAQMANGNNDSGRRARHKRKAKDNYREAREHERRIHSMKPSILPFPGDLPETDWFNSALSERKHYCRAMVAHVLYNERCTAQEVHELTDQLKAARTEASQRQMALRDLRTRIMSARSGLQPDSHASLPGYS